MSVLEHVIAELKQVKAVHNGAQMGVIDAARSYAQMKLTGTYLSGGSVMSLNDRDREFMAGQYAAELLREAERMFLEDALLGTTVASQLNKLGE